MSKLRQVQNTAGTESGTARYGRVSHVVRYHAVNRCGIIRWDDRRCVLIASSSMVFYYLLRGMVPG